MKTLHEQANTNTAPFHSNVSYFFKVCLDVWVESFCVPYSYKVVEVGGGQQHLRKKSSVLRLLVCGYFVIFNVLGYCAKILRDIFSNSLQLSVHQDPGKLYLAAEYLAVILTCINFIHLCWFKKKGIFSACDALGVGEVERKRSPKTKEEWMSLLVIYGGLAITALYALLRPNAIPKWSSMKWTDVYKTAELESFPLSCIGSSLRSFGFEEDGLVLLLADSSLSILHCLGQSYSTLISNTADTMLFFYLAYVGKGIGGQVQRHLQDNKLTFSELSQLYRETQRALQVINETFSCSILCTVVSALVYFSEGSLTIVDDSKSFEARFINALFLSLNTLSFLWAASCAQNLRAFEAYLFEHRGDPGYMGNMEVLALQNEIMAQPLGLKASNFLISYGFIVNCLSTVMTYIIVLLQFSQNSTKSGA